VPRAEWRLPLVFAVLLMTILGVFMFRGFLGAYALFAGALPFVPIAGVEKDMARATAGLVIAVIVVLALVASTLRPLWSRRTYLP
jgi:hypothetical protein